MKTTLNTEKANNQIHKNKQTKTHKKQTNQQISKQTHFTYGHKYIPDVHSGFGRALGENQVVVLSECTSLLEQKQRG